MCGSNDKCKNLKTKIVICFNPSITESEAEKGMAEFYGIVSFRYWGWESKSFLWTGANSKYFRHHESVVLWCNCFFGPTWPAEKQTIDNAKINKGGYVS